MQNCETITGVQGGHQSLRRGFISSMPIRLTPKTPNLLGSSQFQPDRHDPTFSFACCQSPEYRPSYVGPSTWDAIPRSELKALNG